MHSSIGTTGQSIVQCIKCADRNVWKKMVASEEEDKPTTVLYTDIDSLNLSLTDTIQTVLKFIYKYQHLDSLRDTTLNTTHIAYAET